MLLQNINMQQRSKPENVPSPVGGLNRRDALAAMEATDAYVMDNLFPGTTSCKLRNGCSVWEDGLPGPVTSLLSYTSGTIQEMFAEAGGKLYDVTVKDNHTEVMSGLAGPDIQAIMFSNAADNAQWLMCNTGADIPFAYNGSAWQDLAITGTHGAPEQINFFCPYKGRMYFTMEGECGFYYLIPGAIQGAAEFYDLGQICHKGGQIVAITTFSEDSGDGPNQYIVFISDQGEYIMYSGSDPGDAADWLLVGRYTGGKPIGRHAVMTYAGDVLIITVEGVMQFSAIRKLADTRSEIVALSSKLGDYFKNVVQYETVHGWNIIMYPKGGMIVVTAPDSFNMAGKYNHFVMNTVTQAWCRFVSDEWNGLCWTILNGNLYFGRADGSVRQADNGLYDVDKDIKMNVAQAYNYFGGSGNKHFQWVECLILSEAPATLSGTIRVNFGAGAPGPINQNPVTSLGAIWDVSYWDEEYWGLDPTPRNFVVPYMNYGFVASLVLEGAFGGLTFEWYSSKWVFEPATGLL